MTRRRPLALLACTTLALSACGSPPAPGDGTATSGHGDVDVVVGFYPLQYAVERIGGDRVTVTNLTRPGAEPHDVELTPQSVAAVAEADLAVYEKAIQPAVDEAVTSQDVAHRLEVGQVARLDAVVDQPIVDVSDPRAAGHDDDHDHHGHETGTATPAPSAATSAAEHGHDHDAHDHDAQAGTVDPHFWLDPIRYEKVAESVAASLTEADPQGRATYEANLAALKKDLSALHGEYTKGLASCTTKTLVTSHAAFGYLAARYGFEQAAISGLSPDQEPQPQRLAQVADYARTHHVTTIYSETLTDPKVAETLAKETGATSAVLDPLEGLTNPDSDYLSVMRSNLATLRTGQGCR